jgi:hypothetical protein
LTIEVRRALLPGPLPAMSTNEQKADPSDGASEIPDPGEPPRPERSRLRSLRKPLGIAFVLALIVHLPLTPAFPLIRLLRTAAILRDTQKDWDYQASDLSMPLELVEMPKTEPPPSETTENSFAPPPPVPMGKAGPDDLIVPVKPAAEKKSADAKDAAKEKDKASPKSGKAKFAAAGSTEEEDKDDKDADKGDDGVGAKKKQKKKAEKPEDKPKPDPKAKEEKPDIGLAGTKDERVIGKPNFTMAMWFHPMRGHALSTTIDGMFACAPEWRPFVAQGIKPLTELEGVMVSGPQLSDSSKSMAAVQHKMNGERLRELFSGIVGGGPKPGQWLVAEQAAKVQIHRKERVLFQHARDMVFVAPPDSWESVYGLKEPLSLPAANGRALALTLQSPSRPLKKLGLDLPARLSEMRLEVFANADGSADMRIDFEEPSAEAAQVDAPKVTRILSQFFGDLSQIGQTVDSLSSSGGEAKLKLPEPDFSPVDKRITAVIRFAEPQSARMLSLLGRVVCPKKKSSEQKALVPSP